MARKKETVFRANSVLPFLKTLRNTKYTPVQQMALTGDPDYILCVRGKYVDLELKDDDGIVAPLQEWKMSETRRCGGETIVASPSTWKVARDKLLSLDRGDDEWE